MGDVFFSGYFFLQGDLQSAWGTTVSLKLKSKTSETINALEDEDLPFCGILWPICRDFLVVCFQGRYT